MAALLLAAAFGAAVQAVALESSVARPTDASVPHPTYTQPEITQPPSRSAVHELLKRADAETYLVAPDNTCGFVSGRIGAAYTCVNTDALCAIYTTLGSGFMACCTDDTCGVTVDCIDEAGVSGGSCDNGCVNDIYTLKCTESGLPYCGTVRISSSISDFFCQSTSYSTPMDALTTYNGETDGRSYAQVVLTLSSTAAGASSGAGGGGLSSFTSGSDSSATASSGSSGSSSSSGSISSGSNKSSGGGSSTPIGPIVGGVVGGVAVLALIALGIWFILRRKNKNKQAAAAATPYAGDSTYPQMQQSPPPGAPSPGPMGGAGVGHQSVYNPQYPQQQGQQYPSPQSYQQQQGGAYFPNQEKPQEPYVVGHAPVPSTSPMSQNTDPRFSMQPSSPTSTVHSFQPQNTGTSYQTQVPAVPSTVYEAGGDAVGAQGPNVNHRGQFHEMG